MRRRLVGYLLCAWFIPALLAGCGGDPPPRVDPGESDAPTHTLHIGKVNLPVEIRNTPAGRREGLMHRRRMSPDRGMLFVYPEPRILSFWMKNTHIRLSVAFIKDNGEIVNIERMTPESRQSHRSREPVSFALEVLQGWFELNGIGPGDRVRGLEGLTGEAEADPGASTKEESGADEGGTDDSQGE